MRSSTTPSNDRGPAMHTFVGRTGELDVLHARLADARAGRPWIVEVQGPAGIGKTALIERFLAEAKGAGASQRAPASEERTAPESRPFTAEASRPLHAAAPPPGVAPPTGGVGR